MDPSRADYQSPTRAPGSRWGARYRAWWMASVLALAVALLNLLGWQVWQGGAAPAPDMPLPLSGVTYSPFQRWDDPARGARPAPPSMRQDLALLSGMTHRLRSYSSADWPALASLTAEAGLRLSAGVWLGRDEQRNRREIEAAVHLVRTHDHVDHLIAGNETRLHGTLGQQQLITVLTELRRRQPRPVSTAEPWHVWLREPELARHVDFIAVHLLPYWEGTPAVRAVDDAFERLALLRRTFPGRRIVVTEFGWPSAGDAIAPVEMRGGRPHRLALTGDPSREAHASPVAQARVLREFAVRAAAIGLEYYVVEAFDQPWKRATEGAAGPHWGLMDARRAPKFALSGPALPQPWWQRHAALSSLLGFAATLLLLPRLGRLRRSARIVLAGGVQALATLVVAALALPLEQYLQRPDWLWLGLLGAVVALSAAILLSQLLEFAEMYWVTHLRRRYDDQRLPSGAKVPRVSLHLACCNEPPDMVLQTVSSLRALAHEDLEIIVVDNNTRDDRLWQPVRDQMRQWQVQDRGQASAPRMRFIHLPSWPGYKAGALNVALDQTDPGADVIGVVDADYVVESDWLQRLLGHFESADVAIVQSPQAQRGWQGARFRQWMNAEYEAFFRIGMHHRNERNAIVQHGTMTLIRAEALRAAGGWSTATICEDTELGLRLLRDGWRGVYIDRVAGRGLTPDDFGAYKTQRRRWAQGAMQILKLHAGSLFGRSRLTLGQRYHFLAGWLPWVGDALHLLCSAAAMIWTVVHLSWPGYADLPGPAWLLPLLAFMIGRLVLAPGLYARRVGTAPRELIAATLAGMGLSHAIARGVLSGLFTRHAVFEVTRKGQQNLRRSDAPVGSRTAAPSAVREEAMLCIGLLVCALGILIGSPTPDRAAWMLVLGLQSLPYLAALVCQRVHRSDADQRRADPATGSIARSRLQRGVR